MEATNSQELLFVIGINHKTAPLEVREKLYVQETEIPALLERLKSVLSECFILSTCNRTEIYGVCDARQAENLNFYKDLLIDFKEAGDAARHEHFFTYVSCGACRQMFDVATSVDSKIVGDTQILQQLKSAYKTAQSFEATGRILNQLSQRALKIGKKVYTETPIHKGAISISLAAVDLARELLGGSLVDKNILIIGAGETAELTAKCLFKRRLGKLFFTNRTRSNAENLFEELRKHHKFEGEVLDFDKFKNRFNEIDVVISSTGAPEPIIRKEDFRNQSDEILLIDIAIPRDIDLECAENDFVMLKNIDDLTDLVDRNYERRMASLPKVKKIIMQEMGEFLMWYYSLPLLPALEKTRSKPKKELVGEILEIKKFLLANASELHKIAMNSRGNESDDLKNHIALVKKLQNLKQEAFGRRDA